MKKLQFTIDINAPAEKVWAALWNDENYRNWTSVFQEGSYAESDFQEGSKFRFLNPKNDGVWGEIVKMDPNEKMYFLHKGEIHKGEEQPQTYGDDAIENYDLVEKDGKTELTATMNVPEDYIQFFTNVFPSALEKVKEIAEQ